MTKSPVRITRVLLHGISWPLLEPYHEDPRWDTIVGGMRRRRATRLRLRPASDQLVLFASALIAADIARTRSGSFATFTSRST
jgi:hypothetical protein